MQFEFRLALALSRTVGELRASITSDELTYWIAFNQLEPLPEARADWRSAIIAHTVAASQGSKSQPQDFLPRFGDAQKPNKEGVKLFRLWASAQNARHQP